jgi:hypothetical protein
MIYGFAGPHDWIVILAIAVLIAGVLAWGLWRIIGALCRRYTLSRHMHFMIFGAFVLAVCMTGVAISIDSLDGLERICEAEVRKHEKLSGSSDFEIKKHLNYWKQYTSSFWGISEPYQDPQVTMTIHFVKDGKKHQSFLACRYTKIPNSGDPPRLQFHQVRFHSFDFLKDGNRWMPAEKCRGCP